jgi:general secretion pathway protein I
MRRVRGFTLIEVLVALAIVAIGMAAVLGTISSSATTIGYMRDKTFANWVALNQIATLRISGQQTPPGNSTGELDFAGRKWHYRQEVTQTQIPGMVRIDVKIRPADVKAGDDDGWFTTVSGIQGDAIGAPNGYLPDWGSQILPGTNPQIPNNPAGIGTNNGNFGVEGGLGDSSTGTDSFGSSFGGPGNSGLGGNSPSGFGGPTNPNNLQNGSSQSPITTPTDPGTSQDPPQ